MISARSVLLQRDADVVDLDGTSPVMQRQAPGEYHVAVCHRNHRGVMTAAPVALGTLPASVDLTSEATATWGIEGRLAVFGEIPAMARWSGDINFNDIVSYTGGTNDRDPILQAIYPPLSPMDICRRM